MYVLITVALLNSGVTLTTQTSPITMGDCLVMQKQMQEGAATPEYRAYATLQYTQCVKSEAVVL